MCSQSYTHNTIAYTNTHINAEKHMPTKCTDIQRHTTQYATHAQTHRHTDVHAHTDTRMHPLPVFCRAVSWGG